jgi:UDP-glucose 4-epimerase
MRIAVIGATGNAGTALLRRLHRAASEDPGLRSTLEIIGIARRIPDLSRPPYAGVQWRGLDVGTDAGRTELADALAGADAVVHLAWAIQPNHDEKTMHRINVAGTQNALDASVRAGVAHFVCASSVGAYSPGPKGTRVDEAWRTGGVESSHYSRFKAAQERLLDRHERDHPEMVVSRLRPGLIFQPRAGSQIGRYFLGPLVPKFLFRKGMLPLLPIPSELVFQAAHADDVADAYWRVLRQCAPGAFNIAAEPVLTPALLAGVLGSRRTLDIPVALLRAAAAATWHARLQHTDPGWVDMAAQAPLMDTTRARSVLGWNPRFSSVEAVQAVLNGLAGGDGVPASPSLEPRKRR